MSKTVFILGAGASAECGAPLMYNFISKAQEIYRTGLLEPAQKASFKLVFDAREQLQSCFSKAHLDIDNIESLFGIFWPDLHKVCRL